ncbi:MAG: hypothetical protein PF495_18650 [Spirochaetales bacterium]|nr:hypothetical protein [Spirochaetales bacterium]
MITVFMRSLIENWDGKLIAVIVSGFDGDGAVALCGIKEVGGHYHCTEARYCRTAGYARECNSKRVHSRELQWAGRSCREADRRYGSGSAELLLGCKSRHGAKPQGSCVASD